MTLPLARCAHTPFPGRWTSIQALRQAAHRELVTIAAELGDDSPLLARCREVWGNWEREALISTLHQDYDNAEVMLDRGVHSLQHALQLVREDHLSQDELMSLIASA
jgi:hypothetical protein